MSDILSQQEIDALLSAYSTGASNSTPPTTGSGVQDKSVSREVRMYDFTRPERFSKEEMRQIEAVHNAFAGGLANHLSALLRSTVEIEHTTFDQTSFDEYLKSIPSSTLISTFRIEPEGLRGILEINPNIVFSLVDMLTGGVGDAMIVTREVSDIELKLMESVNRTAMAQYVRAWEQFARLDIQLERVGANQMVNPIASAKERMVSAYFEIRIAGQVGLISICVPSVALESVLKQFKEAIDEQDEAYDSAVRMTIAESLHQTDVTLCALLGEASISIQELVNLKRGDILRLNQPVTKEIRLSLDGMPKFLGVPGVMGRFLGVHITREYNNQESAIKEVA